MKVFNLNTETLKQISDLTTPPKIAQYSPKLTGTKNASWRNAQKMKVDSLYEETQYQCSDATLRK